MAEVNYLKKLVFLTGTRADFGKIKPLISKLNSLEQFEIHIFVTGMHMLSRYGSTWEEIRNTQIGTQYRFINQSDFSRMDEVLAKTVLGFSDYIAEIKPDLIVVHGDRIEPLAAAIVGSLNNILVAHIEGGEVSGTIDELLRHSITKLSHLHFVANNEAARRLIQLGESSDSIFVIGSPEMDIMDSESLPTLKECSSYYQTFESEFAIAMLHPVTTENSTFVNSANLFFDALELSDKKYIVIHPNNDLGSEFIRNRIKSLESNPKFRIFPSMRFEYFLQFLKNAKFIIGNSSSGVRQAPHYGTPSINVGTRQDGRASSELIVNCEFDTFQILESIKSIDGIVRTPQKNFGSGNSADKFLDILNSTNRNVWNYPLQKRFVDLSESSTYPVIKETNA